MKKLLILAISYDKIVMFFGELAQLARASRLHREGRGFESHILHHLEFNPYIWVFLIQKTFLGGL